MQPLLIEQMVDPEAVKQGHGCVEFISNFLLQCIFLESTQRGKCLWHMILSFVVRTYATRSYSQLDIIHIWMTYFPACGVENAYRCMWKVKDSLKAFWKHKASTLRVACKPWRASNNLLTSLKYSLRASSKNFCWSSVSPIASCSILV